MTLYVKDAALIAAGAPSIQGLAVSVGFKRKITKMTAYNSLPGTVTLKVYNVPTGSIADATTRILNYALKAEETYLCPEAIGAGLNALGSIFAEGVGVSFSYVAADSAV